MIKDEYHIYLYKRPGGDAFFKRGATIAYRKNQLSSPVAMGDNGHLQPSSRFPGCIMARELKILATNLQSQEIINFYLIFYRYYCVVEQNCHVLLSFYLFLVSGIRLGKY